MASNENCDRTLIGQIGYKLNKPVLSIKTAIKETEAELIFKVENGEIFTLSLDYAIYGVIKKILVEIL